MKWCSHIIYSKNDSQYQGDWILKDKKSTFVDHIENYKISLWNNCPWCAAPRPKEKTLAEKINEFLLQQTPYSRECLTTGLVRLVESHYEKA